MIDDDVANDVVTLTYLDIVRPRILAIYCLDDPPSIINSQGPPSREAPSKDLQQCGLKTSNDDHIERSQL